MNDVRANLVYPILILAGEHQTTNKRIQNECFSSVVELIGSHSQYELLLIYIFFNCKERNVLRIFGMSSAPPNAATNSWSSGYGTCIDASIKMQHEIRLFQFSIHCCSYLSVYSWELKGNNEKKKQKLLRNGLCSAVAHIQFACSVRKTNVDTIRISSVDFIVWFNC